MSAPAPPPVCQPRRVDRGLPPPAEQGAGASSNGRSDGLAGRSAVSGLPVAASVEMGPPRSSKFHARRRRPVASSLTSSGASIRRGAWCLRLCAERQLISGLSRQSRCARRQIGIDPSRSVAMTSNWPRRVRKGERCRVPITIRPYPWASAARPRALTVRKARQAPALKMKKSIVSRAASHTRRPDDKARPRLVAAGAFTA